MPISSTDRKASFDGNGIATTFPFSFKVFQKSDVLVVRAYGTTEQVLTLDSDYTVTISGSGGSVTLSSPLATGYSLVISSDIELKQETDLQNQGGFYPDVLDNALDRMTCLVQQVQEQVDRSLKFPITDSSVAKLPTAGQRAGKFLSFDSHGAISLVSGGGGSGNVSAMAGSLNVMDFGAFGDGSTDDSGAINDAIAAASDKQTVVIPPGTYAITSSIEINKPVRLSGYGATILKKANVIGIHVANAGSFSILEGFKLDASYPAGSADGIVIGDADDSNGAGAVVMRDLRIWHQHGHGINAKNGNSGEITNVEAWANLGDGVRVSSQAVGFYNTNAWKISGLKTISNGGDGLNANLAVNTYVFGLDAEGNTGYGLRLGLPSNYIAGYVEANTAGPYNIGVGSFFNHIYLRSVGAEAFGHSDNHQNWIHLSSDVSGYTPPALQDNGSLFMQASFAENRCTTLIDEVNIATPLASMGNLFEITPEDSTAFAIATPLGMVQAGQHLRVRIKNTTGGALGTVTWSPAYRLETWVQPADGYSRSIDFVFTDSSLWVEVSRSGEIPN